MIRMYSFVALFLLVLWIGPSNAQADQAEITTADRLSILDLISSYSHNFDSGNAEAFGALYLENGNWLAYPNASENPVISLESRDQIIKFAADRIRMFIERGVITKHFMLNTLIEVVSPVEVKTTTMALITWQRPAHGNLAPQPVQAGYYTHVVRKHGGEWKFERVDVHTNGVYKPEAFYSN